MAKYLTYWEKSFKSEQLVLAMFGL